MMLGMALTAFVAPLAAAVFEGQALYRERIMPPADAVLVVTVWDAARADAPATELASTRQRLMGAPPYRWTLRVDDGVVAAAPAAVVRARIEIGTALWMTTDTVTPAFGASPPTLLMRMVKAVPAPAPATAPALPPTPMPPAASASGPLPGCAQAVTQAALNDCAYEDFLEASAELATQLRRVEDKLSPAQRSPWRKVQKAWLGFRTETCRFESAGRGGSNLAASAAPMVQWQCNARLTRGRSDELARSLACREGDLSCVF